MSAVLARRPALRWVAPGAAAALIVAGSQVAAHWPADAAVSLPPKSARQLLVDLQQARPHALSGTVTSHVSLGLPQLPEGATGARGGASPLGLLSGTHTAKVWYDGKRSGRVALLGDSDETDLVANSRGLWLWRSADKSVLHVPGAGLDTRASRRSGPPPSGGRGMADFAPRLSTPEGIAAFALRAIQPSTRVSTERNERIAGRAAYQLVLTPRTPGTTIGSVRIAFDAANQTPLRAQVFAKGAGRPAIDVGFSSISYHRPAAHTFAFSPPEHSSVTTVTPHATKPDRLPASARPRVTGKDWASVLVGRQPITSDPAQRRDLLRMLPAVSGAWGSGHLLHTSLGNAVFADDGRFAVGAVPPSTLYAGLGRR